MRAPESPFERYMSKRTILILHDENYASLVVLLLAHKMYIDLAKPKHGAPTKY